jgi:hypothetical protein
MALPPYLITTILPWKRSSHGSASVRMAALASALSTVRDGPLMSNMPSSLRRNRATGRWSRRWRVRPGVEQDADMHVRGGQVDLGAVLAGGPVDAHLDAVDGERPDGPARSRGVVPMAASTRPQFGSLPNSAHLSRLFRRDARPTSTASSSEAAPATSMVMSFRRALGVGQQAAGRGRRTRG